MTTPEKPSDEFLSHWVDAGSPLEPAEEYRIPDSPPSADNIPVIPGDTPDDQGTGGSPDKMPVRRVGEMRAWASETLFTKDEDERTGGPDFDTASDVGQEHVDPEDVANPEIITITELSAAHRDGKEGDIEAQSPIRVYDEDQFRTDLTRGGRKEPGSRDSETPRYSHIHLPTSEDAKRVAGAAAVIGSTAYRKTQPVVKKGATGYVDLLKEYATRDDQSIYKKANTHTFFGSNGRLETMIEIGLGRLAYGSQYIAASILTPPALIDVIIPGEDSVPAWDSSMNIPVFIGATITTLQVFLVHRKQNRPKVSLTEVNNSSTTQSSTQEDNYQEPTKEE